jgi:ribulose-bisphosphate carboxylase small chain
MAAACASLLSAPVAVVASAAPARSLKALAPARAATFAQKTVSNGIKTRQMLVWQPTNNKFFETLSFLPPLTDDQIAKQVDYIINNGWVPCLEFAESDKAYVASDNCIRYGNVASGYQDNRYWSMYKLPMFGCTDPGQVLKEISNAERAFPDAYIRLVAFDNVTQTQVAGFLVHRPASANDYRAPSERSI